MTLLIFTQLLVASFALFTLTKCFFINKRFFTPFFFYALCMIYLNFNRVFLELLGYTGSEFGLWFYTGSDTDSTGIYTNIADLVVLLGVALGAKSVRSDFLHRVREDIMLQRISFFVMMISVPSVLYKNYEQMGRLESEDYLSLYLEAEKLPTIVNVGDIAFKAAFFVFLSALPNRQNSIRGICFFTLIIFTGLLSGQRSEVFLLCLVTLSYLQIRSFIRLSEFNIGIFIVPFVTLGAIIEMYRSKSGDYGAENSIAKHLWTQSNSSMVFPAYLDNIHYFSIYDHLLSFISPIWFCSIYPLIGGSICANNFETAMLTGLWGHKLSYILNPYLYLAGGGLGGSNIASFAILFPFKNIFLMILFIFIANQLFIIFVNFLGQCQPTSSIQLVCYLYFLGGFYLFTRGSLSDIVPPIRHVIIVLAIYLIRRLLFDSRWKAFNV